jgi:hypothetical protein
MGKENLLDADESTRSVVRSVAIQKAAVADSVAIAITWLLRKNTWYLRRILICPFNKRILPVIRGRDQLRVWLCGLSALVIGRNSGLGFSARGWLRH